MNIAAWIVTGAVIGALLALVMRRRRLGMVLTDVVPGAVGAVAGGLWAWPQTDQPPHFDTQSLFGAALGAVLMLLWTHWRQVRQDSK